jgi:hypothetical protein
VADVAVVQVELEGRAAAGHRVQQRRRVIEIGLRRLSSPDGRQWKEVRKIERVEHRMAHVVRAVTRNAAQERIKAVAILDLIERHKPAALQWPAPECFAWP